jgi:hypothetical protein
VSLQGLLDVCQGYLLLCFETFCRRDQATPSLEKSLPAHGGSGPREHALNQPAFYRSAQNLVRGKSATVKPIRAVQLLTMHDQRLPLMSCPRAKHMIVARARRTRSAAR